ncbi:MAG: hypothetical protein ACI9XO_003273 [Paraglaciecola sp.]|jgi:hypothetical protein
MADKKLLKESSFSFFKIKNGIQLLIECRF